MNARHIRGLNVMSIKLSKKIASADKILYDASDHRIKAITIADETNGSDVRLILFGDVKNIGQDAVMVDSDISIKNLSEVGKPIERMVSDKLYLINTTVVTESGIQLGKIDDFTFDPKTGEVEEIEITQGPMKDMQEGKKKIQGVDILKIGQNTTIVNGDVDEKLASQKTGGLKGMIHGMEDKISETQKKILLNKKK